MSEHAEEEGTDWISAHDQARARVMEILSQHPKQFILCYSNPDEETMGTAIFAPPPFIAASIEVLVLAMAEGGETIAPPPD